MNIAMLQLNPTVGDFAGNARRLREAYLTACAGGAALAVAGELALFGYPPLDLLERDEYLDAQCAALDALAAAVGEVPLVLGVAERNQGSGRPLFNAAFALRRGRVAARWRKALLPTYDVFDEARHFEPGGEAACVLDLDGVRVGLLVCEDIWGGTELAPRAYDRDPLAALAEARPDVLVVPNASPYFLGKAAARLAVVRAAASRLGAPVVYVNQVGANTDLVFDGRSFALDAGGRCLACAPAFEAAVALVDLDARAPAPPPQDDEWADLYGALVLAVRDYAAKTGHARAVLGLSGGVDSAVTACLAADALGAGRVSGLILPGPYSSDHSVADARTLAGRLGIEALEIRIDDLYAAYGRALAPAIGWHEPGQRPGDATEENVQARIRGNLLMALANRRPGTLLLTTGNKSEAAMGYCTLYGDMAGGFAPLTDVWKTQVYALARHINRSRERIPENTLAKPPSAELRPDQKDSDALPPYDVLDPVLGAYLERGLAPGEIVGRGLADAATVARIVRAVQRSEFKRRQMAPGPKLSEKAFGSGRRMPLAARFPEA